MQKLKRYVHLETNRFTELYTERAPEIRYSVYLEGMVVTYHTSSAKKLKRD